MLTVDVYTLGIPLSKPSHPSPGVNVALFCVHMCAAHWLPRLFTSQFSLSARLAAAYCVSACDGVGQQFCWRTFFFISSDVFDRSSVRFAKTWNSECWHVLERWVLPQADETSKTSSIRGCCPIQRIQFFFRGSFLFMSETDLF